METEEAGLLKRPALRDNRVQKHLPIIAVTANVRDEQIKAAIEAGSVLVPCLLVILIY
jgi:CheY-like chemotaxis protein